MVWKNDSVVNTPESRLLVLSAGTGAKVAKVLLSLCVIALRIIVPVLQPCFGHVFAKAAVFNKISFQGF